MEKEWRRVENKQNSLPEQSSPRLTKPAPVIDLSGCSGEMGLMGMNQVDTAGKQIKHPDGFRYARSIASVGMTPSKIK
jgi:hypothetical protein